MHDHCKMPAGRLATLREEYRSALLDDIVPWWVKHSPDRECGGYYTCLERDGSPYAGDKYMWMTGREIWMLAHLFNRQEARPEWRELAEHGARFLLDHAFRENGAYHFTNTDLTASAPMP